MVEPKAEHEAEREAEPKPVRIVPLGDEHVASCGEIIAALDLFRAYGLGAAGTERLLRAARGDPRAIVLAALDENASVLGFAWFVRRGAFDRSGYLRLIAVSPRERGRGVGRLLMEELERDYLGEGGIVLLATAGNVAAHHFYERLGYQAVGLLPSYVRPEIDERIYYKAPAAVGRPAAG